MTKRYRPGGYNLNDPKQEAAWLKKLDPESREAYLRGVASAKKKTFREKVSGFISRAAPHVNKFATGLQTAGSRMYNNMNDNSMWGLAPATKKKKRKNSAYDDMFAPPFG